MRGLRLAWPIRNIGPGLQVAEVEVEEAKATPGAVRNGGAQIRKAKAKRDRKEKEKESKLGDLSKEPKEMQQEERPEGKCPTNDGR